MFKTERKNVTVTVTLSADEAKALWLECFCCADSYNDLKSGQKKIYKELKRLGVI